MNTADSARPIADAEALRAALAARGHLPADAAAAPPSATRDRPWFVALLLGVAAWFAGAFGLGCVGLLLSPSGGAWIPIGLVLLAAAWVLLSRVDESNVFGSQLGLVLSIAGQFALIGGVAETLFHGDHVVSRVALVAAVLQLALVVAMPDRLHRVLSTLFACAAWACVLRFALWDAEPSGRSATTSSFGLALLAWLLAWAPPALLLARLLRDEPRWMAAGRQALLRPACTGLVVALAWATLLSDPLDALRWSDDHAAADALWPLLSLLAAALALLAAFALRSTGLMGMCIVAGLLHVVQFYQALAIPLMAKSLTMLALGAVALAAARALARGRTTP